MVGRGGQGNDERVSKNVNRVSKNVKDDRMVTCNVVNYAVAAFKFLIKLKKQNHK